MKFPLNPHRRPRHALLTESDVRSYFQQEEPNGAKRQTLNRILELGKAAVQEHLQQIENDIHQLDEEERAVLSGHRPLLDVFSAIDQKKTPACVKRDTISDPTGYNRYTTEWYLDERDFSIEERVVAKKIDQLRRTRRLLVRDASYLRGMAVTRGNSFGEASHSKSSVTSKAQFHLRSLQTSPSRPYGKSTASDICITVLSDEYVEVRIQSGARKRMRYSQLGFEDKKSGGANLLWKLLLYAASFSGLASKFPRFPKTVKTLPKDLRETVRRFNQHFQQTFGVEDHAVGKCKDGYYPLVFSLKNSMTRQQDRDKPLGIQGEKFKDHANLRHLGHKRPTDLFDPANPAFKNTREKDHD